MGLFDNVADVVNRGTAAAGRTSRSARLRRQIGDLRRQRHELMAQLGESLYDEVAEDARWRTGRETVLDGIADIDWKIGDTEQQLAQIEAEAQAAQRAAQTYACPRCGTRVSGSQGFCSGCGMPVSQILADVDSVAVESVASELRACVSCGAPLEDGDAFCMVCGAKQP